MASALEAVCGCGCEEGSRSNIMLAEIPGAVRCDCVHCGELAADGTRRCCRDIDPLLAFLTPADLQVAGRVAAYCGECRGHNFREHELEKERAAATRAYRLHHVGSRKCFIRASCHKQFIIATKWRRASILDLCWQLCHH